MNTDIKNYVLTYIDNENKEVIINLDLNKSIEI